MSEQPTNAVIPNWVRVLPTPDEGILQLGVAERPTDVLLHLPGVRGCTVDLDSEGRILGIRWWTDEHGSAEEGFEDSLANVPVPFLLLNRNGNGVLVSDRAAVIVGTNGIAIKRVDGEIEFIPTKDIFGLTFRPPGRKP